MSITRLRHWVIAALLLGCTFGDGVSQALQVGDPLEEYLRVLQISGSAQLGSFTVRPLATEYREAIGSAGSHPWGRHLEPMVASEGEASVRLALTYPRLRAFANSRFPLGRNDGVVWQGRGLTTALDAGATLEWRALTLEVHPVLLFNQNARQELAPVQVAGMSEYAYPWRRIDWPQRFGPDSFWTLDPGQSEIRLDVRGASLGFSTKNLWWGPAIRNPIIMSNNAPGVPHAFLGTDGPADIGIGELEGRWIWGRLQQSDWFDPTVTETDRFITGIVVAYSPSFIEGLSLGATRVFYVRRSSAPPLGDYLAVFQGVRKKALVTPENPEGTDEHDQLLSVFGRWVLAESGFEVFWEWARNDHAWDLRDFLLQPEHSQAYGLGLRKAFEPTDRHLLALTAELTHLEAGSTFELRGYSRGAYYEHGVATQGYTQKGQIIGAGIGPGGNAQSLALDLYAPWGRVGTWVERQVHDNDAYYEWAAANDETYCCHDVSIHWGGHALWFVDDFELGAGAIMTREFNRWFYGLDLWNLNLSLSARWRPR